MTLLRPVAFFDDVGPDQLHGFEECLTTDIYPSDFGWTPDWTLTPHETSGVDTVVGRTPGGTAYVNDESLTSMEEVAKTPLWSAYMERNGPEGRKELLQQDVSEFLAAMKRAGEHLQSYSQKTTLGMTDEQLAALTVPATLILHHGQEIDVLHPSTKSRAATTLLQNSTFELASTLEPILELLLPFVREHTPAALTES